MAQDSLMGNLNPPSGSGYNPPPANNDPKAKKVLTELELGKRTCWTWGARLSTLSSTSCPTYADIISNNYNTIYATGTYNGTAESNYTIVKSISGKENTKLVKRENISVNNAQIVVNVSHSLNLNPADYYIELFLTNSQTSAITTNSSYTTQTVYLGKSPAISLGKSGWEDYKILIPLNSSSTNLIDSTDSVVSRNSNLCIKVGRSDWDYARYITLLVLKWDGSAWNTLKEFTTSSKVKLVTANLGVMWREMIGNRYRLKIKITN